jgi:hypothetical protein
MPAEIMRPIAEPGGGLRDEHGGIRGSGRARRSARNLPVTPDRIHWDGARGHLGTSG